MRAGKLADRLIALLAFIDHDARRLTIEGATSIPSGADSVIQSIERTYDSLGRLEKVTSWSGNNGTGTVQNEIEHTYHTTLGYLEKSEQSHQGAVTTGTPAVQYARDAITTSDVFDDGLRLETMTYPNGRVAEQGYGGSGTSTALGDRLGRIETLKLQLPGSSTLETVASYRYNGTSRLVKAEYDRVYINL